MIPVNTFPSTGISWVWTFFIFRLRIWSSLPLWQSSALKPRQTELFFLHWTESFGNRLKWKCKLKPDGVQIVFNKTHMFDIDLSLDCTHIWSIYLFLLLHIIPGTFHLRTANRTENNTIILILSLSIHLIWLNNVKVNINKFLSSMLLKPIKQVSSKCMQPPSLSDSKSVVNTRMHRLILVLTAGFSYHRQELPSTPIFIKNHTTHASSTHQQVFCSFIKASLHTIYN